LFQNLVGFETRPWKDRQKPGLSVEFKEAVPKTEVLEQLQISLLSPYQQDGKYETG
jgi:hypothetical protein